MQQTLSINTNQLLDDKQTAEIIGISPATLRKSRMKGELLFNTKTPKYLKLGRTVRYKKDHVTEWLKSLDQFAVSTSEMEL